MMRVRAFPVQASHEVAASFTTARHGQVAAPGHHIVADDAAIRHVLPAGLAPLRVHLHGRTRHAEILSAWHGWQPMLAPRLLVKIVPLPCPGQHARPPEPVKEAPRDMLQAGKGCSISTPGFSRQLTSELAVLPPRAGVVEKRGL
jgi:hypothetical protein